MPLEVDGIQGLLEVKGNSVSISDWVLVTQELMDLFGEATGNRQWIHVDPERAARESPIGSTIVAGIQLLATATALQTTELVQLTGFTLVRDRGYDRVRYTCAVLPGSYVRLRVELTDVKVLSDTAVDIWLDQVLEAKYNDEVQTACVASNILRLDK